MARILDRLVGHRETLMPLIEAQTQGRLASTLLFAGPSGVGKKLAAMALTQSLVCERGVPGACGECGSCLRLEKEQSESLMTVTPEGAGIKIEQARDILQFLTLRKLGRSRVVIIDQAHLLNPQAANALLKSLEEPPDGTHFILVTPLAAAVLPTIRSRSQLIRFRPLLDEEMKSVLGPEADPWVIERARGSLETAQRLLEGRDEFVEIEEATRGYLVAAAQSFPAQEISRLKEMMKDRSAQSFIAGLIQALIRDALLLKGGLPASRVQRWGDLAEWASALGARELGELADQSLSVEHDLARNVDRGLVLENFALRWRNAAEAPQEVR